MITLEARHVCNFWQSDRMEVYEKSCGKSLHKAIQHVHLGVDQCVFYQNQNAMPCKNATV